MTQKFAINILVTIIEKKLGELKEMVKKYPMLKLNFSNLEEKINTELITQLKIKEVPKEKVDSLFSNLKQ